MTHSFKTAGAVLMPYWRIGGKRTIRSPFLACIQTDGVFHRQYGGRHAAIITSPCGYEAVTQMVKCKASNTTEAEWSSVAFGLSLALENNYEMIGLENDNLGIISALMFPQNSLKHEYAKYYRHRIQTLSKSTRWTGIRWIPQAMNKADVLFH